HYPIAHAINGKKSWWQSPSIKNGMEYHYVTITLDLQQIFQIAYIIIKAANSPRPGNWILERSLDGITYKPWQYYAITDGECLTRYNIIPRPGIPSYTQDDEVICTSHYSKIHPLENGEIHASLINGRPSAEDPSTALLEFTSARFIQLRLQRIRTLNADLMMLAHSDPTDMDPIVTRRYFYSIKDISVGGMCICYGHARACPWDPKTNKSSCECEHNTCGASCDRCCPGFHQKPWRAGTFLTKHECEACNCHGKTAECYYDQEVANKNLSLNIHGDYIGGGVCVNCTGNTAGINCETCIDRFYRPQWLSPNHPNPCRPCNCDPIGSLQDVCVKDSKEATEDLLPGSCYCRPGYAGEKCNQCDLGYTGYPDCLQCNCSVSGSINEDPCVDPCICKENVAGDNCDVCKHGFFNSKRDNPRGCDQCFCSGVSNICIDSRLSYAKITDMNGWYLTELDGNIKVEPTKDRYDGPQQLSIRRVDARSQGLLDVIYWSAPASYLRNKVAALGGYLIYTISYDTSVKEETEEFTDHPSIIIEGNGIWISTTTNEIDLQPFDERTERVVLRPEFFRMHSTGYQVSRKDFMTVMANVNRLLIRATYSDQPDAVYRSCSPGHRRVNGTLFGGKCEPCRCFGHSDSCDDITGFCKNCLHSTYGRYCDYCLPGFYGNPTDGTDEDCLPCACPMSIASNNFSPTCHLDPSHGLVCDACPPGYTGLRCERCADGYFGQPLLPGGSCKPCQCNDNLNLSAPGCCDSETGACLICKAGVTGDYCNKCAEGYFGDAVGPKSCQPCNCNINGSLSTVCNLQTGQCECRSNVRGWKCDECLPQTYGPVFAQGCVPCNCNSFGSKSFDCDENGQCHCQPGITGPKCDRCDRGFYDFQEGGCTPCDCPRFGNNCDEETGQCICPPNTIGEQCEKCAPNHWGYSNITGCKACDCGSPGSLSTDCDPKTGCCFCRPNFSDDKCTSCRVGYRNYPHCVTCDCVLPGSKPESCDRETEKCSCAEETGQCSCKMNVEGVHCDRCKPSTFGLHEGNPLGCSSCYCFGLTNQCTEADGLIRMWQSLKPDQTVLELTDFTLQHQTTKGVFFQHPEIVAVIDQVKQELHSEPFYWKLPEQFEGRKLTAYGGKLKYTIYFEAREETGPSAYEPQVVIRGGPVTNHRIIVRNVADPQNGQLTRHDIDMTEFEWKHMDGGSVSREDFMDVLYDIQYILIKASYGRVLRQTRISEVFLEVAEAGTSFTMSPRANLIEKCECPVGYSGLSCESCAPGFYRVAPASLGRRPGSTLGTCVPCQCNGHSDMCDPQTSVCQVCKHNTTGDHCERCSLGFYGIVRGFPDDCNPCACPLHLASNNFSPTCIMQGTNDYRCTACPRGYEGQYCERCASGYTGNPGIPGSSCEECECNPYGSLSMICHPTTGQCTCKPEATGLKCAGCTDRHVREGPLCAFCDDECTGLLLDDLDQLNQMVMSVNLSGPLPPPYRILFSIENETQELKAAKVSADGEQTGKDAKRTNERAKQLEDFVKDIQKTANDIYDKAVKLNETLGIQRKTQDKSFQELQKDVDKMMAELRRRIFKNQDIAAADELRAAEGLLNRLKKLFQDPHNKTNDLNLEAKGKLSNFQDKLDDVMDMLREARGKIKESNQISAINAHNMTALEGYKHAVEKGKKEIENTLSESNDIMTEVKNLAQSINETEKDLINMNKRLPEMAENLDEKIENLTNEIQTRDLPEQVLQAELHAAQLKDSSAKLDGVTDAGHRVKQLEKEADRLLDKLKPIKELQDNLGKNISQIKELINQARKQANSIKVSVSSGGDCIRTYKPDIKKGRYNTIILNVKTSTPDNLLFYLGSKKFVTIRIECTPVHWRFFLRSGINGTISVVSLDGPKASIVPSLYSSTSQPGYTILDVDANAQLFVGGLTEKVKKPDAVKTTTFSGCMGETFLDSKPIGLWNYRDREGDCKGCSVSPQMADSEGTVQFDGDGYALVGRPVRWNPNISTIMFKFKTFASNALLMYLATNDLKDFMSVELSDGRIKVSYDLGSGTASAVSNKNHNDGKWKSFTLSRIQKQANFSIVDIDTSEEEKITTTSTGSNFGLNLKADEKIYFGGLPGLSSLRPEVNLKKYAGCLKDIEVSRTPYNLLSSSDYIGLTKGCALEKVLSVSFSKPGYIEVPPVSMDAGTEITLSFSTKNESGMILFGNGGGLVSPRRKRRQSGQGFYAVLLRKGNLEVSVSGPKDTRQITVRPEKGEFHDGKEHSIRIERSRNIFTVQVDEDKNHTVKLPASHSIDVKRLFVGGIPSDVQFPTYKSIPPFEGCIWDLLINAVPIDFAQPVSFENADIGHCLSEEEGGIDQNGAQEATKFPQVIPSPQVPIPSTEPDTTEVKSANITDELDSTTGCAADIRPEIIQGAKQFGLSRNSHMAFAFDDTKVKNTLSIELELRTKADSGLIFYMARINHADFATIQIKDGMAHFRYDLGSGDTTTMVPQRVNDGEWHKINIFRTKQTGYLFVDGIANSTNSPKKADILDVVGMLYVGGLPINYTTKRIGPVLHSIDGCIRNFRMVEGDTNFNSPTSSFNVGSCFVNPQKGTYFDGSGFAKTGNCF
ncbi:hypothetical protein GDO78_001429, partial [Eleutherodactylus coqui]